MILRPSCVNLAAVCDDHPSSSSCFLSTDATAYSGATFGQGSSLIIALDDVSCIGEEASLFSCTGTANHDCTHAEDAGVLCVVREYSHN